MAGDFLPYANLRVLWTPPGTITSFRSGVPAAGSPVVIEAFVKGESRAEQDLAGIKAGSLILEGYLTRWAPLPSTGTPPAPISWLSASTAFSWSATGQRPPGLLPGATGKAILTKLDTLPTLADGAEQGQVRFDLIGHPFGIGGIGDELRTELGDKIRVSFDSAV